MKILRLVLAAVLIAASTSPSRAAVILDFFAESVSIDPGSEVSVPIYLQETLTDGSQSLITAEGGLFSAGFHLELSSGIAEILNLVGNILVFDHTVAQSVAASVASNWAEQDDVSTPAFPNGQGRILFGTVAIKAPSVPGEIGVFTISRYQTGLDTILTYDAVALDSLINSSTFTMTVVPEPAGLLLVGAFTVTAAVGLRRLTMMQEC